MRALLVALAMSAAGCFTFDRQPQQNGLPLAAATAPEEVSPGETVLLDGSASSDPDGDLLAFRWSQVEGHGEPIGLVDADAAVASFVAPARGQTLFFRLIVSDGYDESAPAIVQVRVNGRPVAEAGPKREVVTGEALFLDGEGTDPDGDAVVGFAWKVESAPSGAEACLGDGAGACLSAADRAWAAFTPPIKGEYLLSLVVSDGKLDSLPDQVAVRALNRAPVAVASGETSVRNGEALRLGADGSSDPDGDAITGYRWSIVSQPPGAAGELDPADGQVADPSFTPHGKGSYYLGLEVVDDEGGVSAQALLRVDALNNAPEADAGEPVAVANGTEVFLLGAGLDADGDTLQYAWTLLDHPPGGEVVLREPGSAAPHFTPTRKSLQTNPAACGQGECYVLGLTVFDGVEHSAQESVVVTSLNQAPVADAGPDQTPPNATAVLDGSASHDPDGDALVSFVWQQVLGPDLTGGAGFLEGRTLTVEAQEEGVYAFELVVGDGEAESAPDRVVLSFQRINQPPLVSLAATSAVAVEGEPFALDASASADPDGDPLTIIWTRVEGDASFPAQVLGAQPNLVAPPFAPLVESEASDNSALYEVVASDGSATSQPQQVRLFVAPGARYLVVSTGVGAADVEGCGTVAAPCATLGWALSAVDPDRNGVGDGRDVVMTEGQWNVAGGFVIGYEWKGGTSLFGGRDPVTFAPAGVSQMHINSTACMTTFRGLLLGNQIGADVQLRGFRVAPDTGCSGLLIGLECVGCGARVSDAEIVSVDGAPGNVNRRVAVLVSGAAADLSLERLELSVLAGKTHGEGVAVESGARVEASDLRVTVTTQSLEGADGNGVYNTGLQLTAGELVLRRSVVELVGEVTLGSDRAVGVNAAGALQLENCVIVSGAGGDSVGLQAAQPGSAVNNTFLGAGNADGLGAAVRAGSGFDLMNNLLVGFPRALWLDGASALASRLHANGLSPAGTKLAVCDQVEIADAADLNAASGTACNTSGTANAGNFVGSCPLVGAAQGDWRLNTAVANDCVDAGLAASPAGVAPMEDFEGYPRPGASGLVDVGADEADQ